MLLVTWDCPWGSDPLQKE